MMINKVNDMTLDNQQTNVIPLVGGETGYTKNARVTAVNGKNVTLVFASQRDGQRNVEARIAFSCTVVPRVNDTVVCVQNEYGMHIVLAILDRPDDGPDSQDVVLNFPANLSIHSSNGNIGLSAKDKVSILAGESLLCASDKTIHKSREALINYQNTMARGAAVTVQFKTMHILSEMINTIAKNAFNKFSHYVRRSSESDQVSAAQMDRKVDGLYSMNSKNTLMISKKDTKIDGERIHMG